MGSNTAADHIVVLKAAFAQLLSGQRVQYSRLHFSSQAP